MSLNDEVMRLLESGVHPLWRKVNRALILELSAGFQTWALKEGVSTKGEAETAEMLVHYVSGLIDAQKERISQLNSICNEFNKNYLLSENDAERRMQILNFARELGAEGPRLKTLEDAFSRWFGRDAVVERYRKRIALTERRVSFYLHMLGSLTSSLLMNQVSIAESKLLWRRLRLEKTVKPLLTYEGDDRICTAAFSSFYRAISVMHDEVMAENIDEVTLQYIYRLALDPGSNTWLQISAINLLQGLSRSSLAAVLRKHLAEEQEDPDHIFVRRRCVSVLGRNLTRLPELCELVRHCKDDKSPFVRQALPEALLHAPADIFNLWMMGLTLEDPSSQVRAAGLLAVPSALVRTELYEELKEIIKKSALHEKDPFVNRVWLRVSAECLEQLVSSGKSELAQDWHDQVVPLTEYLHQNSGDLSVRRWAAQARESMWCVFDPKAHKLKLFLLDQLEGLLPGDGRTVKGDIINECDEEYIGRVLSLISQEDYGYELVPARSGWKVFKGHVFAFRGWRFLHELMTPSPDKRQAFRHTVGRVFRGTVHVPSSIMAELSETKVPGEPLFMPSESGWRPYLPLLDEVLSSLSSGGKGLSIYTSEGLTEVKPPSGFFKRIKAYFLISVRFAGYARMRNWIEESRFRPSAYIEGLAALGIKISYKGYKSPQGGIFEDPAVKRFFPLLLPLGDLNVWPRLRDYFFSVYQNNLEQLALYTLIVALGFFGHKLYQSAQIRKARRRFPVVIGGWGTRGKSGAERLKSAMVNALGFSVVSKTTGCEAMFIHGHAFGTLREMFIFRPYDKATIWEQHDIVTLAANLEADFFLWECMALTPAYVRILQRDWLRDDLSTITNAYPDHEDIQGPSGINVAEVIAEFVPRSSVLVTTEEHMRPVFVQAAKKQKTQLRSAGWLEAGMITKDVLDRFPYEEHPYNIALVLDLAAELGVEKDFVLKEIADRVIPDIGALKVFPVARVNSRRLEFTNGMSANDRYGCLSNWERTGFGSHDPRMEPGVWVTTLVNNRADRVARSQVFARILAEDISADRHFLIGTNLKGLMGYIRAAYDSHLRDITLNQQSGLTAEEVFFRAVSRLRIPLTREHIALRLSLLCKGIGINMLPETVSAVIEDGPGMLSYLESAGAGEHARAIASFISGEMQTFLEFQGLLGRIRETPGNKAEGLDGEFRDLLKKSFFNKFVIIEDINATGEQIINRIVQETPPGMMNRIMGMQNIKGTGLDFVYRWQAWDKCYNACKLLNNPKKDLSARGLRELSAFSEYGQLSEEHVRETVKEVKNMPVAQTEHYQAELSIIVSTLETEMRKVRGQLVSTVRSGMIYWLIDAIEAFLDAGDSIRRRKMADRIYRDLVAECISHERAALELQDINKRQKGGWLIKNLHWLRAKLTRQP